PVAPAILRARAAYQSALETGCSAEETEPLAAASQEFGELWSFIERFAFGKCEREPAQELCA
ncbi:MAG: hypothetical protein ACHP7N_19260, partial [Caulobacterales bacterium]